MPLGSVERTRASTQPLRSDVLLKCHFNLLMEDGAAVSRISALKKSRSSQNYSAHGHKAVVYGGTFHMCTMP